MCTPCGVGCPPCPYPYAQVCMLTPPCCVVPTEPKYVKPMSLPSGNQNKGRKSDPDEDFRLRLANFYNYYNVDYRNLGRFEKCKGKKRGSTKPCHGTTVDGKSPRCDECLLPKDDECEDEGCPTGFKPCKMKLCPPAGCDPLGIWKATIQACPPK